MPHSDGNSESDTEEDYEEFPAAEFTLPAQHQVPPRRDTPNVNGAVERKK
jgi:hypothetical protein